MATKPLSNIDRYYSQPTKTKELINDDKLSDICFLFGDSSEDQKKIYGHKVILSMASEVFKKMFFGDLAEKNDLIEIPDLTPTGFMNMIRYIYGEGVNFGLHETYETFMAGNKYMVHKFSDAIREYLNENLNKNNKLLIYDQLIKIKMVDESIDDKWLDDVRRTISESSFNNDYFYKISDDTLVDVLSMECLEVDEVDILQSCLNRIDKLRSTIKDKRASFKFILPYIRLSGISLSQLTKFKQLDSFLTEEEICHLFFYLIDSPNRSYPFEIRTKRKQLLSMDFMTSYNGSSSYYSQFKFPLIVDHNIVIRSIETSLTSRVTNLEFKVSLEDKVLDLTVSKDYNSACHLILGFPDNFIFKSGFQYQLEFTFNQIHMYNYPLSSRQVAELDNGADKIVLEINSNPHCIRKINFFY